MTGLPGLIVDAELGNSVVYEEYRGNLILAREAAERAVASAKGPASAEARLALAVVHLLRGELRPALAQLDMVEAAGPDPAVALRVVSYRRLATEMRWQYMPDFSGTNVAQLISHPDYSTARWSLARRRVALAPSATDSARLEAILVVDLACESLWTRHVVSDPGGLPPEEPRKIAMKLLLDFHEAAVAAGAPTTMLAYSRRLQADVLHRSGVNNTRFLQDALALSEQADDLVGAACSHLLQGDWGCTAVNSPLVLDHYLKEGSQSDDLGWTQESLEFGLDPTNSISGRHLDAAEMAYDRAAELFRKAGAPRGVAAVELRRGFLAERRGNLERSHELAHAAWQGFERTGDVLGSWLARAHIAVRRIGLGQPPEDHDTAEALGAWGAGDGSFTYALGLGLLFAREGRRWLIRNGDYERSLACFRLAETTFASLGAQQNLAMALADQAEAYSAVGEQNFALPAFEKAFAVLADLAAETGERTEMPWARAVMLGTSAYNLALRVMDPDFMARSEKRISDLLRNKPRGAGTGVSSAAVAGAQSLIAQNPVLVPLYRGQLARQAGRSAEAETLFDEALRHAGAMSEPSQREFHRAVVLGTRKKYRKAAKAYQQHRKLRASPAGGTFFEIMQNMLSTEERRLKQSWVHEEDAAFLTSIRAYAEAATEFSVVSELRGDGWWLSDSRPWESLGYLGEVAEGLGRHEKAVGQYEQAIGLLEARRGLLSRDELKTALSGSGQFLYFQAARACLSLAAGAEAASDAASTDAWIERGFRYAERGRARALLDLMSATVPAARAPIIRGSPKSSLDGAALAAQWRSVSARLSAYRGLQRAEPAAGSPNRRRQDYFASRIAAVETELRDTEAKLAQVIPDFRTAINPQAEVIDAADLPRALSPGTVLLAYFFLGDDFLAWAFTSNSRPRYAHFAIDAFSLSQRIRALHDACQTGRAYDAMAADLAATFLEPFTELIDQARHLIVIPYGAAHLLPFGMLPWDGQPLIASRSVSTLPSASALRVLAARRTRKVRDSVLAIGNPSHMSRRAADGRLITFPPLRGAAVEAAAVARMFGRHATALIGRAATLAAVRAEIEGHAVIHFATHGHLSEENPLLSAVLLADGQELAVHELIGLKLDGSLVVLSACRTALGETTAGDDVLGLSRGLLAAGAGAALVTLWPVGDISTCLLMQDFYHRLLEGEPPAAALRRAQDWLRTMDAAEVSAALAALPAAVAERSAHLGRSDQAARDTLEEDLQDQVMIRRTESATDYRHPRHWAPFVLVCPPPDWRNHGTGQESMLRGTLPIRALRTGRKRRSHRPASDHPAER